MTTTFRIINDDICKEYICDETYTFSKLKEEIIKDFNLKTKYIDIDFQLERPIRTLGMFNLEPGISPRTLDNYTLDRFGIQGRSIDVIYSIVDDFVPFKKKDSLKPFNLKKYTHGEINSGDRIDTNYNLESVDDFPSLS